MTVAHRQLLDLIEADLLAATPTPVAGGNVQRQRNRPLPAAQAQQVSLYLVRSRGRQAMLGGSTPIEWHTAIGVECIARAAAGVMPDEAVADLLADVHARITGSAALFAASYRIHPEYDLQWDDDTLDERIGACTAVYTVRHFGALASLSV